MTTLLNAKALRRLFYCLLFVAFPSSAANVALAWDAVADPGVAGYALHYGTASGTYTVNIDVGNTTTYTVTNLADGTTYFFTASAYATDGRVSGLSNEVSATTPAGAPNASFSASPSSGTAPLSVAFTSVSSGTITAYAWNFGDGGSATTQNASHVYNTVGSFGATLTVSGPGGSSTSSPSTITVLASGSESLFTSQSPALLHDNDGVSYEMGMRFTTTTAGQIIALKFWKDSSETGTHVGHLWDAAGNLLATATFSGETAAGWQTQNLASPYNIAANTEYMVSVNTGAGFYVDTVSGLVSAITNGHLVSVVGTNGRFGTTVGSYPTQSWNASNYFRDIVFVAGSPPPPPPDTTPPTVPGNVVATANGTSAINVVWGASTDNVGVSGYRLERCQVAGCSSFAQIATPTGTTFGDNGLASGTSYSYRVRASDAAGNLSGYSSVSTAVTGSPPPPPPPTDTTPPVVAISSPSDGAVLNGKNVVINSSATDDVGVASMSLAIDGAVRRSVTGASLSYTWNIRNVSRGQHTIAVTAKDAAGNQATKTITVTR